MALPSRSSSTRRARSPSATACCDRRPALGAGKHATARTRSTRAIAPARAAARRSARAMRSMPPWRRPANQLVAANATGCLEVFSTPYPETSWQIPWIHSLFGNAAAVATGIAAAMKVKGRDRRARHRQGGDGGTDRHRVRLPVGHVRAQRRRALHLLRQRGVHEHRRAAFRPPRRRRRAPRRPWPWASSPGNLFGQGKNVPAIAMAHGIPYVATATVGDLHDLEYKVERAMRSGGRATSTSSCRARSAGATLRTPRSASAGSSKRPGCSRCSKPSRGKS